MMFTKGAVGLQRACGPALLLFPEGVFPRRSALRRAAKRQRKRFLLAGILAILDACLAVGFIACIVLEAFDSDPQLWPFGTEKFDVASQGQPMTGGLSAGAFAALNAIQCWVIPAGANLVWKHRARSDLAPARPAISIAFNEAEPRCLYWIAAPVLGHSLSWIQAMGEGPADQRGPEM